MAQLVGLTCYQINNMDPFAPTQAPTIDFPFAGIMVRSVNSPGTTGQALSTGQVIYSAVQLVATGVQYLVAETAARLVALS